MSDNMIGPGAHEDAASAALMDGRIEDAKVVALASAVNRLASAQETLADT